MGTETILLVEDEEPVRELVRRVLEGAGYEVLAAGLPSEAERLLAEAEHVDLMLTDVVMPEMSGYDLAARVRETPSRDPAHVHVRLRAQGPGRRAGAGSAVEEAVCAGAARTRRPVHARRRPPGDCVIAERVLCVDDDAAARKLLVRLVTAAGHECVAASSVDEARRLLAEQSFSVVLCDIGLPGRSGLELLDELARTRPDVATVMVTGEHDPSVANTALQLGAYGYITKPFGANELLIDLTNALHRRRLDAERRAEAESALQRALCGDA